MTELERMKIDLEIKTQQIQELAAELRKLKNLVGYGFVAIAFSLFIVSVR